MDVFCPNCLHSLTLEGRAPGRYTFDCPECAAEAAVTIPQNPAERPIVRPVRSQSSGSDSQVAKPRSTPKPIPSKSSRDNPRPAPQPQPRSGDGARPRRPKPIDFPFEASDENLVDVEQKAPQDEFESPEYAIPQPLRGAVVRVPAPEARPKRRKQKQEVRFESYLMGMVAAAGVWLLLVVAGLFVREAAWGMIFVGAFGLMMARRTFLRVARQEDPMVWLACLLVPFYTLFFALAHFRQTVTALLITFFGYGFLISGVVLFAVHDVIHAKGNALPAVVAPDDDDPDDEQQKVAAAKIGFDNLTLTVDGKQTRIPVNQLTWFEAKPGQLGGAEGFEFSGPDVSLRGSFPPGFRNDWAELLGPDVPILPKSDQPEPGESHLKLPGRGVVKVTGGAFSLSGAMTAAKEPALFGMIELEIAGPEKPETIRGTFSVRVKAAK
jgi:hypothetical protein